MSKTNTEQMASLIRKSDMARDINCPYNYSDIILNLENLQPRTIPISGPIPSGSFSSWFVAYQAKIQSGLRGSYFQIDPNRRMNKQSYVEQYNKWDAGKKMMQQSLESYVDCAEAQNIVHNNKVRHFIRSANHMGLISVLEYFNHSLTLYTPRQWDEEKNIAESYTGYKPVLLGMAALNYAGIKQQGLKLSSKAS